MTITTAPTTPSAPPQLKANHRAMWASGDYPSMVEELVAPLGPVLVDALGINAGERVLDVAAGTGSAAVVAAARGADVTASDLTPELLSAGRTRHGDVVRWTRGDAEDLPFLDGDFDVVMSAIGIMFAPFHQTAASELVRVTRPGGRIGVLSWTPAGFIGQLFAAMKPFAPPPPEGATPPPRWGDPEHVGGLLAGSVTDLAFTTGALPVGIFGEPGSFREYFKARYGPTIAVYKRHADDPVATAELDAALDEAAARFTAADGSMAWEYVVATGTRTA